MSDYLKIQGLETIQKVQFNPVVPSKTINEYDLEDEEKRKKKKQEEQNEHYKEILEHRKNHDYDEEAHLDGFTQLDKGLMSNQLQAMSIIEKAVHNLEKEVEQIKEEDEAFSIREAQREQEIAESNNLINEIEEQKKELQEQLRLEGLL